MTSEDLERSGSSRRQQIRGNLRSIEAAAIAGIVHSVLLIIAMTILLATPDIESSQEEIRAYYQNPGLEARGLLAFNLVVFSMIGFIWFVAVIRHRIGDREPRFFATIFFGGGVLYAALTLVGAAVLAAPLVLLEVGGQDPDPAIAAAMRSAAVLTLGGAVPRVQALVVFSTATLGRITETLPKWLVLLSYLIGLALLVTVTFFTPGLYLFPAWVALVSVAILIAPRGTERMSTGG